MTASPYHWATEISSPNISILVPHTGAVQAAGLVFANSVQREMESVRECSALAGAQTRLHGGEPNFSSVSKFRI